MMRQIAGSFAQYEKARLVGKAARRPRSYPKERGHCEGRQPLADLPRGRADGEAAAQSQPQDGRAHEPRKIAAELAAAGHVNTAKYRGGAPRVPSIPRRSRP